MSLVQDESPELEIRSVVGIAPANPGGVLFNGTDAIPYLAVLGSRDFQTRNGGIISWERVATEETSIPTYPTKSLIWAYDVAHNAFGGSFMNQGDFEENDISAVDMFAKGRELAIQYVPPFLRWQVLGDLDSRTRFTGDEIPPALSVAAWWDYLPQWNGRPLLAPTFQLGTRPGVTAQRLLVETFETSGNGGEGIMMVDPGLSNHVNTGLQSDVAPDGPNLNRIMVVNWNASIGAAGVVSWELDASVGFPATHVSVRVGNFFDGFEDPEPNCVAVGSENSLSFDLVLETTAGARVAIRLLDPSGVIVQDHGFLMPNAVGCQSEQVMSTFRIPMECFVSENNVPFVVDEINRIEFRVGEDPQNPTGRVLVDSIELTASTEEIPGPQDCSRFVAP